MALDHLLQPTSPQGMCQPCTPAAPAVPPPPLRRAPPRTLPHASRLVLASPHTEARKASATVGTTVTPPFGTRAPTSTDPAPIPQPAPPLRHRRPQASCLSLSSLSPSLTVSLSLSLSRPRGASGSLCTQTSCPISRHSRLSTLLHMPRYRGRCMCVLSPHVTPPSSRQEERLATHATIKGSQHYPEPR